MSDEFKELVRQMAEHLEIASTEYNAEQMTNAITKLRDLAESIRRDFVQERLNYESMRRSRSNVRKLYQDLNDYIK